MCCPLGKVFFIELDGDGKYPVMHFGMTGMLHVCAELHICHSNLTHNEVLYHCRSRVNRHHTIVKHLRILQIPSGRRDGWRWHRQFKSSFYPTETHLFSSYCILQIPRTVRRQKLHSGMLGGWAEFVYAALHSMNHRSRSLVLIPYFLCQRSRISRLSFKSGKALPSRHYF